MRARMLVIAILAVALSTVPGSASGAGDGATLPVCVAEGEQHRPDISGRWIVWEDERGGYDDVYAFDLVTGTTTRLTSAADKQGLPVVDGDRVVWEDYRNGITGNLYAYDLRTRREQGVLLTGLFDRYDPDVSGTRIVWADTRNGTTDIYSYDLATGMESEVCTEAQAQSDPSISGAWVVWEDMRESAGAWGDIYARDLLTARTSAVCTDPAIQESPVVSGTRVVWQDYRNDEYDIYAFDLATGRESVVCTAPGNQTEPSVSGNRVVWQDARNGGYDVYAYDFASRQETAVCTAAGSQLFPVISGDWVVWKDVQGDQPANVYATRVTPPANDAFGAPLRLYGSSGARTDWNVRATRQAGEPDHALVNGGASLWYSWTAPASGQLTIDLAGSTFDTVLAVYRGTSITGLSRVGYNNDVGTRRQSKLTVAVTQGVTYRIAVDGRSGATGLVKMSRALTATLTKPAAPTTGRRYRSFTLTGLLRPQHKANTYAVQVQCWRLVGTRWVLQRTLDCKVSSITGASRYSLRIAPPYAGRWRYRGVHKDTAHVASYSPFAYVRVY